MHELTGVVRRNIRTLLEMRERERRREPRARDYAAVSLVDSMATQMGISAGADLAEIQRDVAPEDVLTEIRRAGAEHRDER